MRVTFVDDGLLAVDVVTADLVPVADVRLTAVALLLRLFEVAPETVVV